MQTPIDRFHNTLDRCMRLISLHASIDAHVRKGNWKGGPLADTSDFVRSAVVLSVAGMDAYFTDKFVDMLVPYLKRRGPTRELAAFLQSAGLDAMAALEMLTMKRPYRRLRSIAEAHLRTRPTQRRKAIDELFLAYGLKSFTGNAMRRARRKNLWRRVEKLVERRHQIVHEADLNAHGRLRRINYNDILGRLTDLLKFVSACDKLADRVL